MRLTKSALDPSTGSGQTGGILWRIWAFSTPKRNPALKGNPSNVDYYPAQHNVANEGICGILMMRTNI